MCEMTGFTERGLFASAIHADAAIIAELNSLRRVVRQFESAREAVAEIDARVVARARRMGLSPDAMGDAIEDVAATALDDGSELLTMDEVRDAAGNRGTVAGRRGEAYMVIFDTPTGTQSLVRERRQLTRIHRAVVAAPVKAKQQCTWPDCGFDTNCVRNPPVCCHSVRPDFGAGAQGGAA